MRTPAELSAADKAAGRRFRDDMHRRQARLPAPDMAVPVFLAVLRHKCPGRRGISTSLDLVERYRPSPADGDVPAGRFAWLHREGTCRRCGLTVRTPGRLVVAASRRPLKEPRMSQQPEPQQQPQQQPQRQSQQPESRQQESRPQDSPSVRSADAAGPTYPHPDGINDPVDPAHNDPATDEQARRQADERG